MNSLWKSNFTKSNEWFLLCGFFKKNVGNWISSNRFLISCFPDGFIGSTHLWFSNSHIVWNHCNMAATWAIWCSFQREFQAKLDFEILCTLGIETKELSFFFYWKNRVFFHIQRGRPFFMTPSPPTSPHVLFLRPLPPTWGMSFVNGP